MEATVVGLVISALVPKLLELLKSNRFAPFINHYSPWVNRTTAIAIAFLTALGVTIDFDSAAGVLTIGGLLPEQMLRLGLTWLLNFGVQELVYRQFVNQPSSASRSARRGDLLVVMLAAGLTLSGCAGKSRAIAVQADATMATILTTIQQGADALVRDDCKAGQPCITIEQRREISPALLKALRLGRAFNEALAAKTPVDLVKPLVEALAELRTAIERVVPPSVRTHLVTYVERAFALLPPGAATGGQ